MNSKIKKTPLNKDDNISQNTESNQLSFKEEDSDLSKTDIQKEHHISKHKKKDSDNVEMTLDEEEKINNLQKLITQYLNEHTIYEAIPEDMKILVFNDELLIKDSIEAMIKEDIYCGLLWNNNTNKHSGVFTLRDVLGLLLIGYKKLLAFLEKNKNIDSYSKLMNSLNLFLEEFDYLPKKSIFSGSLKKKSAKGMAKNKTIIPTNLDNGMEIEEEINNNDNEYKIYNKIVKNFDQFVALFDEITLQSYLDLFNPEENEDALISLFSESDLETCVKTILNNGVHRLIVRDKKSGNVSGFITYETIFEFFFENYYSSMTEFNIPLKNLGIVTKDIISLNKKDTLYKCMETFYENGVSMIPIYDNNNDDFIFGYFYLKDIIYFFSTGGEKFNFNDTIENFMKDLYDGVDNKIPYGNERIVEINDDRNLKQVFEDMSTSPERKIIVHKNKKVGIITLYDIFKKLII